MVLTLTHVVLEFGLLVTQIIHLLHQVAPLHESARTTPWYSERRWVWLSRPRHKRWKYRRTGENCWCCYRH